MAQPREAWVNEPVQRGTMGLIWSCFSTLGLCVWTAVHPNIQLHPSPFQNVRARLAMMITAILFPEIIISAAWRQLELARWLRMRSSACKRPSSTVRSQTDGCTDVDGPEALASHKTSDLATSNLVRNHEGLTTSDLDHNDSERNQWPEWSISQAFFAVMGGFAVDNEYTYHDDRRVVKRSSLATKGVEYLFLAGAPPRVSDEDVQDRNNSDPIAKSIVAIQITWFAVQVVARLAARLPLSALEIHTVVHAGCAVIMFVIWKNKPYALSRPIVLDDTLSKKVAALLVCKEALKEIHRQQEFKFYQMKLTHCINRYDRATRIRRGLIEPYDGTSSPPTTPRKHSLIELLEIHAVSDLEVDPMLDGEIYGDSLSIFASMAKDAREAYIMITTNHPYTVQDLDSSQWSGIRQTAENFAVREVWGSWKTDIGHQMDRAKAIHFGFCLAYGLCHLGAWYSSAFPTREERILWRVSSLIIAAVFLWGMIWLAYWKMIRSRWDRSFLLKAWVPLFRPLFMLGIMVFALARYYLFLESFISLRSSPKGMYVQLLWTSFLPHAG